MVLYEIMHAFGIQAPMSTVIEVVLVGFGVWKLTEFFRGFTKK